MATKKKNEDEIEAGAETKPVKAAKEKSAKAIKAQKPEKLEKAEKSAAKEAEKAVPKKERAPARKLGGDTGVEAAAAESRERAEAGPAAPARTTAKSAHAREYRREEKYSVGETIYHPIFKEEGKVLEVGRTEGNLDKIVVEFDRLGTKRLVCNYTATTQPE